MALDDMTKENGSTRIVPASHRRPWPKAIMTSDEAMEPAEGQVRLNCTAGTVVVVDGNVVRQSLPPPGLPFPADCVYSLAS